MNHFDLIAPIYDRLITPPEESRLIELINLPVSGFVLDAGGGTGRIAQLLQGDHREVIVQDSSHKMLLQAVEKAGIRAVFSETEDLPFAEESFDRIVIVDAYHHLREQQKALGELLRVMKSDGILVIEEPNILHWAVKLVALAEKLILMRSHFQSPKSIAETLQALGAETKIEVERHNAWIVARKR